MFMKFSNNYKSIQKNKLIKLPLAATSVATKTGKSLFFISFIILLRSSWCISPCNKPHLNAFSSRFFVSSAALTIFVTKIKTFPAFIYMKIKLKLMLREKKKKVINLLERNSTSFEFSHCHFCGPSGNTLTIWVMFSFASPNSPWIIRIGSARISRANFSTFFLNVALNKSVCLFGLTWLAIDRTWGSKPFDNIKKIFYFSQKIFVWKLVFLKNKFTMSNILSASSNTK